MWFPFMSVYFNETFGLRNEHCLSIKTFVNFNIIMIVAMLNENFQNIHKTLNVKMFQYKRSSIFQRCIKFEKVLLRIQERWNLHFWWHFFSQFVKVKFKKNFMPPLFDRLRWTNSYTILNLELIICLVINESP
jgi:hypothetical protein